MFLLVCTVNHAFIFLLLYLPVTCQEWTWENGENTADVMSTVNGPGSRSGSSTWRDINGDVWLFGGKGFSDVGNGLPILLNDLWNYNTTKNKWYLIHPGTVSITGITQPLNSRSPSPRHLSASCGVTNLTFVVFGGLGDNDMPVEDTWLFYIEQRVWLVLDEKNVPPPNVNINSTLSKEANRTVKMNHSSFINSPEPQGNMASWCLYNSLLIFSGKGRSSSLLTKMWKLSLKTLEWEEIDNITIDDSSNSKKDSHALLPRAGAITWVDNEESLYMFGGNTLISSNSMHTNVGYLSDLWHFNLTDLTWKLLAGSNVPHKHGIYGKRFSSNFKNIPGSRQSGAAWVDSEHNLWLFGGDGIDKYAGSTFKQSKLLSDLWKFNVEDQMWIWMGGSDLGEAHVKYSAKGEISRQALIGGRCRASVWVGSRNHFYIFGGIGHDSNQRDGYLNDLWLIDVDRLVVPFHGITMGTVVIFTLLIVSLILIIAVVSVFARDREGTSVFNRFDHNIKYSHLSTTGD